MSRTNAAVRLLLVSLPLAFSLPQIIPPYQLLNATDFFSSPTGVPSPVALLDPGIGDGTEPDVTLDGPPIPIEPGIGDDTGPEIFVDPLLPVEPIPEPIPTETIPIDPLLSDPIPLGPFDIFPPFLDTPPEPPSVSVTTFLSIVQPLLDLISTLFNSLPGSNPLVRPLAPRGNSLDARQTFGQGGFWGFSKPATNTVKPAEIPVAPAVNPVVDTVAEKPVAETLAENPLPALPILGAFTKWINNVVKIEANGNSRGNALGKRDALPEASSDALLKFYASLASDQEPVENLDPFTATLRESFEALDDNTKAKVLRLFKTEPMRLELAKRQGAVGMDFINDYSNEYRFLYPILERMRPEVAEGLQAVLEDPTIPLPPVGSLKIDDLPDRIRKFVLDMYTFFDILGDSAVPSEDKMQFLENLSDGLDVKKRDAITKRQFPVGPDNIIVDGPSWDEDRVRHVLELFYRLNPGMQTLALDMMNQLINPLQDPHSSVDVDFDKLSSTMEGKAQLGIWEYYQFEIVLYSLSGPDLYQLLMMLEDTENTRFEKRAMRHGLRIRQGGDEGAELDDAPKLGGELDYALGENGSLDPMGQNEQYVGDQYGDEGYQEASDGTYSEVPAGDESQESMDDSYADSPDELAGEDYNEPTGYEEEDPSSDSYDSDPSAADADSSEAPADDFTYPDAADADTDAAEEPPVSPYDAPSAADSNPSALDGPAPAPAPASQDSFQDYEPNNVDLIGAFSSDIKEPGDVDPEPEVEKPDLGVWGKYGSSFINDVLQGEYGAEWAPGDDE